jgi:DNA polymerase III delta subunit
VFKRWKDGLSLRPAEIRQYLPFQKPYPAFKLSKAAERLKIADLLSLYNRLTEFEVNFKSGTREDQIFLEMVLLGYR